MLTQQSAATIIWLTAYVLRVPVQKHLGQIDVSERGKAMPSTNSEKIRDEVVKMVARDKGGKSAQDLVQAMVTTQNVQAELVQQALRRLLEQGALVIGPDMNLLTQDFRK